MERDTYLLHRDGLGQFLLQSTETGLVQGLLWAASPQENARAFSYDYGSVWYPDQIVNLGNFPELAEMPFFTIESGGLNDQYFKNPDCQEILPMVGATAKNWGYYVCPNQFIPPCPNLNWEYTFPNPDGSWAMPIFSLWVNEQGCWTSNRSGWVVVVNHQGELIQRFKLKHPTRFLMEGFSAQDNTPVVSCEDGFIYELTSKIPESIYTLRSPHPYLYQHVIVGMTKSVELQESQKSKQSKELKESEESQDLLFVADLQGQLFCINESYETLWEQQDKSHWLSFFLGTDDLFLYQGYYQGLTVYEKLTGTLIWKMPTPAPVLCGVVLTDSVILGCSDRQIYQIQKSESQPNLTAIFQCSGIPYAIITDADQKHLWISDSGGKIYQLKETGEQQDMLIVPKGAALALQLWHQWLYVGTSHGNILCLELTPEKTIGTP